MKGKRQTEEGVGNNIKEWTGMDFAKMVRDCCELICGAPTNFQGYVIE